MKCTHQVDKAEAQYHRDDTHDDTHLRHFLLIYILQLLFHCFIFSLQLLDGFLLVADNLRGGLGMRDGL